jgi:hypothetical protein
MLRIKDEEFKQLSVFNLLLPKSSLELKGELAVVDKILDEGKKSEKRVKYERQHCMGLFPQ